MTIDDLKRALVEVRDICTNSGCVNCPFHKNIGYSNLIVCPLTETKYGADISFPSEWFIDDWKEVGKDA